MNISEQECVEILPWYLNGTLSAEEKQAVESQLENSEELREQLFQLQQLRQSMPEQVNFNNSELGWHRLQKQIRNERQTNSMSSTSKSVLSQSGLKRYVATAASLVIAVQIGLFTITQSPSQDDIRLLGDKGTIIVGHRQLILQLQFTSGASWQQVQELVRRVNGDIVQGPSALGIVQVRFDMDTLMLDQQPVQKVEELVDWFKQQKMVRHVAVEVQPE